MSILTAFLLGVCVVMLAWNITQKTNRKNK